MGKSWDTLFPPGLSQASYSFKLHHFYHCRRLYHWQLQFGRWDTELQYNLLSCAHAYCSWSNSILSWPNLTDYICSVVGTDLPSSHIIVTLHPAELKEGTRNVDPHLLDNSQQRVLLLHRTPQWAFAVRLHLFFIVWAQETDYRVSQEYYLLN